jgi:hypothetical protein
MIGFRGNLLTHPPYIVASLFLVYAVQQLCRASSFRYLGLQHYWLTSMQGTQVLFSRSRSGVHTTQLLELLRVVETVKIRNKRHISRLEFPVSASTDTNIPPFHPFTTPSPRLANSRTSLFDPASRSCLAVVTFVLCLLSVAIYCSCVLGSLSVVGALLALLCFSVLG